MCPPPTMKKIPCSLLQKTSLSLPSNSAIVSFTMVTVIALSFAYDAGYDKAIKTLEGQAKDILFAALEGEDSKPGPSDMEKREKKGVGQQTSKKQNGAETSDEQGLVKDRAVEVGTLGRRRRLSQTVEKRICELGMDALEEGKGVVVGTNV